MAEDEKKGGLEQPSHVGTRGCAHHGLDSFPPHAPLTEQVGTGFGNQSSSHSASCQLPRETSLWFHYPTFLYLQIPSPACDDQPHSLSASPGATARLTCTLSSGFSWSLWDTLVPQKPGSPPCYILSYDSDSVKHQDSGVPSNFSESKDASVKAG